MWDAQGSVSVFLLEGWKRWQQVEAGQDGTGEI